jgi:hypothetical protein
MCIIINEGTTVDNTYLQRYYSVLATYLTSSEMEIFADYALSGGQKIVGEEEWKTSPTSVPYSSVQLRLHNSYNTRQRSSRMLVDEPSEGLPVLEYAVW